MSRDARFLTGPTMGHVARMTLTGAMGITFVFLVDAANLFWISQLGDERLMAAIGFAFAIQFFSVSSGVGLMIAATALVSRRIGQGDRAGARHLATAAMVMTCGIQSLVALLIILFRWQLLDMVGAEGETRTLAARYLVMTVPSLALMAIGLIGSAALRAEGDGKRAMFVTLTSGSVSMVVDPILILWLGMGLDGAATALVISRLVLTVMALRFATGTNDLLAWPSLWAVREHARAFLGLAAPAILTQLSAPFGNYLLTGVMAQFGDGAVAAWAVVNRLYVMAFGGIFSLSGAIGGIFGQNYGARLYDRLHSTYRDALIFCILYSLVAWGALMLVTPLVVRGFGLDAAGEEVLRAFTFTTGAAQMVMGMVYVSNAAFNALGRPMRSTLVNWLRDGVLLLPVAWWTAGIWAAPGVIYGQAMVGVLVGILAALWAWRFVHRFRADAGSALDLTARRGYRDVNRYRRR
ncbi:MATE family efflux transporter [Alisedimentitalea sp. MJ-SS2]|uniref:MATE family efflux transporter n=1 Tax=Aliisedimentitalea sp. MJ-SS2 TaxID=3049795 RepID=UPI00290F5A6C|nr:MATE family efflux transporter [Alisedimentitalea sp. MJ-SS2]MDU8928673.1 MATE family efflux transporter [Alisedimentitalea sp. MJ-SS2]